MRLLKKAAVEGHFVYAASVFRKLTWYLASSTSWHIFSAALRVRCNILVSLHGNCGSSSQVDRCKHSARMAIAAGQDC